MKRDQLRAGARWCAHSGFTIKSSVILPPYKTVLQAFALSSPIPSRIRIQLREQAPAVRVAAMVAYVGAYRGSWRRD